MNDLEISSRNYIDQLAYSIGVVLGNGYMRYNLSDNGNWYSVEASSPDMEVVERFIAEVESVWNVKYALQSKPLDSGLQYYFTRTSREDIFQFFYTLTYGKTVTPIEIIQGPPKVQKDFLAGCFDTDGSVKYTLTWNGSKTKKNPRWQLGFSNTKPWLIQSVAALLSRLGVQVGKIGSYTKAGYLECFSIHPNIRSFIDAGCYFHSKRKQQRLFDYLNYVVGSTTRYSAPVTTGDGIV